MSLRTYLIMAATTAAIENLIQLLLSLLFLFFLGTCFRSELKFFWFEFVFNRTPTSNPSKCIALAYFFRHETFLYRKY